jgi:hypothetical protein
MEHALTIMMEQQSGPGLRFRSDEMVKAKEFEDDSDPPPWGIKRYA